MSGIRSTLFYWKRNKAYSIICLLGLSISLVFVILIAEYTAGELSTDSYQTKADRIYVLGSETVYGCAAKLADKLTGRYPEIEKICVYTGFGDGYPARILGEKTSVSLGFADSTFFDFFDFRLISGDRNTALGSLDNVIISESFANRMFGPEDPVGKTVELEGFVVTVAGVLEDITNSIFLNYDIILRMEQMAHYNPSIIDNNLGNAGTAVMFILARENADITARIPEMKEYFKTFYWIYEREVWQQVLLTPLRDVYFSDVPINGFHQGDSTLVIILISVGVLILLFALINYINLTVAQAGFRAREMSTRRLLGSSRRALFGKLIYESLIICTIAFILALVMALGADDYAGRLLGKELSVLKDLTPADILFSILGIFVLGAVAGVIPARIISGYEPIEVVRGSFKRKSKMFFGKVFITVQNVITIVLIACSITMTAQVHYMMKARLGYNTDNIIVVDNMDFDITLSETFRNELMTLPGVEKVAFCRGYPLDRGNNNTVQYEDRNISFQVFEGDSTYFDMMGFEVIRDNHTAGQGNWFNESAMRKMDLKQEATHVSIRGTDILIAGILKDFQYGNVTEKIGPATVVYNNFRESVPWSFLIKVNGDPVRVMKQVGDVFLRISGGDIFSGEFINDQIRKAYEQQEKTSTILIFFTIIAIVLSALGLLAMATYFVRQRALEIAMRKVFGSTVKEIVIRLVVSFLRMVLIAFIISVPVIWYAMSRWLSDYPLRITLGPWIFILAGLLATTIAFVTVYGVSRKAAITDPAEYTAK